MLGPGLEKYCVSILGSWAEARRDGCSRRVENLCFSLVTSPSSRVTSLENPVGPASSFPGQQPRFRWSPGCWLSGSWENLGWGRAKSLWRWKQLLDWQLHSRQERACCIYLHCPCDCEETIKTGRMWEGETVTAGKTSCFIYWCWERELLPTSLSGIQQPFPAMKVVTQTLHKICWFQVKLPKGSSEGTQGRSAEEFEERKELFALPHLWHLAVSGYKQLVGLHLELGMSAHTHSLYVILST